MASCWRCCSVHPDEKQVDMADVLQPNNVPADPDVFKQLLVDINQTLEWNLQGRRGVGKVPMSKEVESFASHLEKHLNEVVLAVQVSKDAINALDKLPWVGAGLTIIAMGLNMTLKTLENREQCNDIMKESLDLWKKVMQPVLDTRGAASEFMGESINIIIEGYLYCRNLTSSRAWKRFICASNHEKELMMWKKKQADFLSKACTIMNVEITKNLLPRRPTIPKTSPTTLVGLEERKKDVLKLLNLEDKEEIVVVVLHGMGGVGKSTLGDAVYNQASLLSRERRRSRIEVGEKPSKTHITTLQRKIVEDLTGKSLQNMERDEAGIEDNLRRVLLRKEGDPVLIYIDNVLQARDLEVLINLDCELIQIPKGSRLLVTTRDLSVCNKVFKRNRQFSIREFCVKVMDGISARKLFFRHAFGKEEPSTEEVRKYDDDQGLIEKMVSSICGCLPLALRVLGRSLTNMDVAFWRRKYKELESSRDSEFEGRVTNVLKSSYEALDPESQTAFLIACVCFYDRPIFEFKGCVTSLLPKATSTRLFELGLLEIDGELLGENLKPILKVHDLVRNLGFGLAVERKCAYPKVLTSKEDLSNIKDEVAWHEVKWLRVPPLEDGIEAALLEQCKELEILVLHTHVNGHIGEPPRHLKAVYASSHTVSIELGNLKKLTVWDAGWLAEEFPLTPAARSALQIFEGFRGPHISEEAIDCHKNTLRKLSCKGIMELSSYFCEKMTELQWLGLNDYKGKSFPKEMRGLAGLEFLMVKSPSIEEFPQNLAHLKRLHHLILDLENGEEIPRGVLGAMTQLVWLGLTLGRAKSMPMQDIAQLVSLEVLVLELPLATCLTEDMDEVSDLIKLDKLRWLTLRGKSMGSLQGVRLSCPSVDHVFLELGKLQVLPARFITGATKLRSVGLERCLCLQELSPGTELLGAVESLLVRGCTALKALPEGLGKTVESLAVVGCEGMKRLPADVVEDEIRAGDMRLLLCDARLLPPHLLSRPSVFPYTDSDWRARQRLDSFLSAEFALPVVNLLLN